MRQINPKPIVSVDLANIDKPVIKFKKASSVEYAIEKLGGLKVEETIAEPKTTKTKRTSAIKKEQLLL